MSFLPKTINKVSVPPIKCQGIKTKLVPFIAASSSWSGEGRWIEPFLGSGVVLFNIQPERALVADTNKHIIRFYQDIQSGDLTADLMREYLQGCDETLRREGGEFYYETRKEFNEQPDSFKFMFLNRSCFNGLMRFNRKGGFNVPFGKKPERFRQAYITKICNQISNVQQIMRGRDWHFVVADWRSTIAESTAQDFVYLDPPYIGRNTDYFNGWTDEDAVQLAEAAASLPCKFALSMWKENRFRKNEHLLAHWASFQMEEFEHFYHVGSSEKLRNKMTEVLVMN